MEVYIIENVKKVREQAIEIKKIYDEFFKEYKGDEREFRASFHLRPTSSGDTTILSTLPIAPMRGISVSNNKLKSKLSDISKVLNLPDDDKRLQIMKDLGFSERRRVSRREEDAQATLIRSMILNPEEYNYMHFIASEFDLFEYGGKANETKRLDVLAFKDGILYDIELKNERLTETVRQAAGYVEHIKKHLAEYTACLAEFPNYSIEEIKDIRGIALVPYIEKSGGGLEKASEELGVELWFFTTDYVITKSMSNNNNESVIVR